MSTGKWFLTLFLLAIPVVGLILLFVWAFGSDGDPRREYARAVLLWYLVGIVASIVLAVILPLAGASLFSVWS